MISYLMSIHTVEDPKAFITTLHYGGLWHGFSSQIQGHLGTSVLESSREPSKLLVLHFWKNPES